MSKLITAILLISLCAHGSSQDSASVRAPEEAPKYSPLELLEVWGWLVGEQFDLSVLDLSDGEVDAISEGIKGYVKSERPDVDFQNAIPQLQRYIELRQARVLEEQLESGKAEELHFFDSLVGEPNIQSLGTGLHFEILDPGSDVKPVQDDFVKVHYRGTLLDGKEFDSSYARNEPAIFQLNKVIPGWSQGMQLVGVGGKIKLYIPAKLGYGDAGSQGVPPASALIFDVELLEIVDPDTVLPTAVP